MYAVATQDYTADINIIPRKRFYDPRKLLAVLSPEEVNQLILDGERATWPRIEMIRNCTRISQTLDRILTRLEYEHVEREGGSKAAHPVHRLMPSPEISYGDAPPLH